jgi:hypothetical protein
MFVNLSSKMMFDFDIFSIFLDDIQATGFKFDVCIIGYSSSRRHKRD